MKIVWWIIVLAVVVLGYMLLTKNKENGSSMNQAEVGQNGAQEPSVSDRIDAQFGISEEDAYKMYPDMPRQ